MATCNGGAVFKSGDIGAALGPPWLMLSIYMVHLTADPEPTRATLKDTFYEHAVWVEGCVLCVVDV